MARAIETSRPLIDARRHELTVTLPPQPECVKADLVRLAQVLANLLNNAAKYTEDGGRIVLDVVRVGDEIVFRVCDNGIGIAPEKIGSVFDLFTQIDRSIDRSQGGLGVGLTLVRELVEMHGGSVEAHSGGANRGSEFVVRLPGLSESPAPATGDSRENRAARALPQGGFSWWTITPPMPNAAFGRKQRRIHDSQFRIADEKDSGIRNSESTIPRMRARGRDPRAEDSE